MSGRNRSAVKVRWMRGSVMGPWATHDAALKLQADLQREVIECGDGYGFVTVEGFDGREVLIRGREVVVIECIRETPASVPPATTITSGVTRAGGDLGPSGGVVVQAYGHGQIGQVAPGTEFLRHQARVAAESGQRVHR